MTGPTSPRPNLKRRLLVAFCALGAVALIGHVLVRTEIGREQQRLSSLNLSGHQRAQVFRIALLAHRIAESPDSATTARLREDLANVISRLDSAQQALAHPDAYDALAHEVSMELRQIRFEEPIRLESRIQDFLASARGVFEASSKFPVPADVAAFGAIQGAIDDGLPEAIDRAVLTRQEDASRNVLGTVQWISAAILGASLVIVGFAIIRPAAREIERENELLRGAERRFRAFIRAAPDAVVVVDKAGRIVLANSQTEALFGYRQEELVGRDVEILVPDRLRDIHAAHRQHFFEQPGMRPMGAGLMLSARRRDGSEVPVEISLSPIEGEDGGVVIAAIRDVTERRRAAAALVALNETLEQRVAERTALAEQRALELARSNEELQQFAYVASHDLREPLRKVEAFGERLAANSGEALDELGRDYLARMRNAVARMQALIDGLLMLSRVGTATHAPRPVDLAQTLREVTGDLEVEIERSGARVTWHDLPAVEGDPLLLRQLFQNLISNSCKFVRPGVAPVIEITGEPLRRGEVVPGPGGWARVFVRDNGIGFDDKYRDRIFQVFQRLHGRSEYEGTGIGLAICRKIVLRHGGAIEAHGIPGEGAVFTLTLPLASAPAAASAAAAGAAR